MLLLLLPWRWELSIIAVGGLRRGGWIGLPGLRLRWLWISLWGLEGSIVLRMSGGSFMWRVLGILSCVLALPQQGLVALRAHWLRRD